MFDKCPRCGWSPHDQDKEYRVGGPVLRKITNVIKGYYPDDGDSWIEHYRCPKDGVLFTVSNGT